MAPAAGVAAALVGVAAAIEVGTVVKIADVPLMVKVVVVVQIVVGAIVVVVAKVEEAGYSAVFVHSALELVTEVLSVVVVGSRV